ncbi:MAG: RluA family pseudouridine synthase [Acidobacteriota bacterium]
MNNQKWKVSAADAGVRLDKWLAAAERMGSRSRSLAAIEKGKILVNDAEQSTADAGRKLIAGENVRLWMDRPGSSERRYSERHEAGLHIIYEDSSLLVLNKPAGLLAVPLASQPDEPSLFDQVKYHLRSTKREPFVVHRIDRDTSGLVVFAKTGEAQHKLKDQFEKRDATRIYLAVVYATPDPDAGTWRDLIEWDNEELKQQQVQEKTRKAQEAVCRYKVLEKFRDASLIEVRLVSGKRNQIRIQAGLRGHPLIGEKMYVYENPLRRIEFPRQALHAHKLSFKHPAIDKMLYFEAPLPDDMKALLATISKNEATKQTALLSLKPAEKTSGKIPLRNQELRPKRTTSPIRKAPAEKTRAKFPLRNTELKPKVVISPDRKAVGGKTPSKLPVLTEELMRKKITRPDRKTFAGKKTASRKKTDRR